MSVFVWIFWRLGWARPGVVGVDGWRRLILRLWWRRPHRPPAEDQEEVRELAPKRTVHWSPADGFPLCGASVREWWTFDIEYSTCAACQERGRALFLQNEVNLR